MIHAIAVTAHNVRAKTTDHGRLGRITSLMFLVPPHPDANHVSPGCRNCVDEVGTAVVKPHQILQFDLAVMAPKLELAGGRGGETLRLPR